MPLKMLKSTQQTQPLDQESKLGKKLYMRYLVMLRILKSNTYQKLSHRRISQKKKSDLKVKLKLNNPLQIKLKPLKTVNHLLKKHQLVPLLTPLLIVINLWKFQNPRLTRHWKNSQAQVNLDQSLWKQRRLTKRLFMTYKKLLTKVLSNQETLVHKRSRFLTLYLLKIAQSLNKNQWFNRILSLTLKTKILEWRKTRKKVATLLLLHKISLALKVKIWFNYKTKPSKLRVQASVKKCKSLFIAGSDSEEYPSNKKIYSYEMYLAIKANY